MRDIKFRIWDGAKNEWLASSNKDALPYYGFFSDGGFVGECAGVAEPLFELTNLEIAGNIHKNPELLEEK